MTPFQQHLHRLNKLSSKILLELEKEEPSIEFIGKALDQREVSVSELEPLTATIQADKLPAGEREALKSLFDEFYELNIRIQRILEEQLNRRQQDLASATRRRKAADGYQGLEKPDISYFSY